MRKKKWISRGVNAKMENSRRVTVNLTGNPGDSTSEKSISLTGGVQFFSLKKPNEYVGYVVLVIIYFPLNKKI